MSPFVQGTICSISWNRRWQPATGETVEQMVAAYADRVFGSGGEIPFDRTPEFAEVFGEEKLPEGEYPAPQSAMWI